MAIEQKKVERKTGVVSMRLRPAEQGMFDEMAQTYGLYGATNAVRAAGRVLKVLGLNQEQLLELLMQYETSHPDEEPVRFVASDE